MTLPTIIAVSRDTTDATGCTLRLHYAERPSDDVLHGVRAMLTAAPAAPKQAEAQTLLPERLMRFLLRDLKAECADLAGFLSLNNEVRRAAEYDEWIAAVESYCQQYAHAAPRG